MQSKPYIGWKVGNNIMSNQEKETLLALINGLTTYVGESQYYEGTPCIKGNNIQILVNAIKNMNN